MTTLTTTKTMAGTTTMDEITNPPEPGLSSGLIHYRPLSSGKGPANDQTAGEEVKTYAHVAERLDTSLESERRVARGRVSIVDWVWQRDLTATVLTYRT